MAAITTAAAGNWSATGTWTGGVIPGNGDTVTLNHAVTCDDNRIVGVSPVAGAATAAILVNANLTIAATLTCRGDIKLADAKVIQNAGSIFEFDASQAGTPGTAIYIGLIGTAHNQVNPVWICNGTQFSRCTIRSVNTNGGANGHFTDGGFLAAGSMDLTYTDLLRIGDASNNATGCLFNGTGGYFDFKVVTHTSGGQLGSADNLGVTGRTIRFYGVSTSDSKGTNALQFTSDTAVGNGIRRFENCMFDKNVALNAVNLTVKDSLLNGMTGGSNANFDVWDNVLMRDTTATEWSVYDGMTNCYVLKDGNITNPHFLQPDAATIMPKPSLDGMIFEMSGGTNTDGDSILIPQPASARTYFFIRCILLPNDAGTQSGTLVSSLGNANVTFSVNHCTYCSSDGTGTSGVNVGETYNSHAGMIAALKDNIGWSASAGGGFKIHNINGAPVTDVVTGANADFNTGWNLTAGSKGKGYDSPMTVTPGANDIEGDPQFLDKTRNIKTWDTYHGGPGTAAHALAEIAKRNDASGWNSQYTIRDLWSWVRLGFQPKKASLATGASDGTTIGAVPFAPTVPTRVRVSVAAMIGA